MPNVLTRLVGDVRYGVRRMRREWGFTAAVVLTLGVGIGATTAAFGIVDAVLLRPLPVRAQERLAVLSVRDVAQARSHLPVPNGVLWGFAHASRTVAGVAGVPLMDGETPPRPIRVGDRVLMLGVTAVTGNFFQLIGVVPHRGRVLEADDDHQLAGPAVVLSYAAWQRAFGGRPDVVGQILQLAGTSYRIVGVAPEEFAFPSGTDLWVSNAQLERQFGMMSGPNDGYWDVVVRLRPGVTMEQARAEFEQFVRGYTAPMLGAPAERRAQIQQYADVITGDQRPGLLILVAAAALVCLVALGNVAALLLTRGLRRMPELALRAALGARRVRLVAQLTAEHAVLGAVGLVCGLGLAAVLLRATAALAPAWLTRFDHVRLDWAAFEFATVLATVAVLICGLAPAASSARRDLEADVRGTGRMPGGRSAHGWWQQVLVTGEVALAVVVLAAAGLLVRTLTNLHHVDLGFEPRHVLYVLVQELESGPDINMEAAAARHRTLMASLVEQLPADPRIAGASVTYVVPFSVLAAANGFDRGYQAEGQNLDAASLNERVTMDAVSESYFHVLGIPLRRGRVFTAADDRGAAPVVIIGESLARAAWPGQDPIGKQLRFITAGRRSAPRTVVGVVADTRYHSVTTPRMAAYIPVRQAEPGAVLAIRTRGDPLQLLPTVRAQVRRLDPGYVIGQAYSGNQLLDMALARPRLLTIVLTILSVTTVVLAGIGLFGVLSYSVRQRLHEIGVRLALGASAVDVRMLVARQAATLLGSGLAIGLLLVLGLVRVIRAQLYDVTTTDPLNLASVVGLVFVVGAAAAALPAIRASRADPLVTLRSQ